MNNRGGFRVNSRSCRTCIFRKDTGCDLARLLDQVRDKYGGFKGHRICHHEPHACCRGFWNRFKNRFQAGQIAQRLNMVVFVTPEK
jgi:hypothetical protein